MFEDRDFLLRTIRNLVDGLLGEQDSDVAAMESRLAEDQESAGAELLGPGGPPLVSLSEEEVVARLTETEAGSWRLARAGAVLLEGGALADAITEAEGAAGADPLVFYTRSLRCYLEAGERPLSRLPAGALAERLAFLLPRLRGQALSESSEQLLLRYFERGGRYAELEDLLFERVSRGLSGAAEAGRAAMTRLLDVPDEALMAGGLSRDEVRQALAELGAR